MNLMPIIDVESTTGIYCLLNAAHRADPGTRSTATRVLGEGTHNKHHRWTQAQLTHRHCQHIEEKGPQLMDMTHGKAGRVPDQHAQDTTHVWSIVPGTPGTDNPGPGTMRCWLWTPVNGHRP